MSSAEILRLCADLERHVTHADNPLRILILKYFFSEWKWMVNLIIAVARKLCELTGQKGIFRQCLPILTNLSSRFGKDEMERWNERTFVLFILKQKGIDPQMAFILMRLIEWVVEYPGFVSFFRRVEHTLHGYYPSSQDGEDVYIQVTGDFFNFLIQINETFKKSLKKRVQTPVYLQRSFFATRVTLCSLNTFRVLKICTRERENLLVLSGIASKLIERLLCEGPKRMPPMCVQDIINRFIFPKKIDG
jgi:hypothetical protein